MRTALVTCGGGFQGLGLVQALRRVGDVRVLVCDIHADSPTRYACHDYLVCPPLAHAEAFKAFLLSTVEEHGVEFVFPATALELRVLAHLQAALGERGTIAAVAPQPLLDRLLDKQETRQLLNAAGVPAEATLDPRLHDYAFPLIGKPRTGWGGRGAISLDTRAAAQAALEGIDAGAYVWSRKFEVFDEYSADFAIGAHQAVSTISIRKRMRTSGGFAVISEFVESPLLDGLFGKLVDVLAQAGGYGCFNAQAITPRGDDGALLVSDINPRLGTSATHGLAEGTNLPAFFMDSASGRTPAHGCRRKIKTVRRLVDLALPSLARRPRGVAFDLDDTLVDHRRWMLRKMEQLYAVCFDTRVAESDYRLAVAQLIDEHDWPRLIDRTLEVLALPASLHATAIEAYRSLEIDTPLFDDVEPALAHFKQAGIKLAILTDNPPATQRSKILRAPALHAVDAVVFSRECGGEKPCVAAFHAVADRLELAPHDLVMVGDNWFRDGVGAVRAGYAHALVIRRDAMSLDHANFCAQATPNAVKKGIDVLPDLVAARYTCLDAPA